MITGRLAMVLKIKIFVCIFRSKQGNDFVQCTLKLSKSKRTLKSKASKNTQNYPTFPPPYRQSFFMLRFRYD